MSYPLFATLALLAATLAAQTPGTISTVAGNGSPIFSGDGGPATSAGIGGGGQSLTLALDSQGNLYLADQANNRIRRVNSNGTISTFAGGGAGPGLGDGGPATAAQVFPNGIAIDGNNNVYIASGAQVRRVAPNGIISTIAGTGIPGFSGDGGPALQAQLNATSIAAAADGTLYLSDALGNRIRKITPAGIISTIAGTGASGFSGDGGPATSATLALPQGLAVDATGNIYFADSGLRVRKISPAGIITTVAGNGSPIGLGESVPATSTGMSPSNIVVDSSGALFIADTGVNRIRKVSPAGLLTTVAGSNLPGFSGDGGPATSASLFNPRALALDSAGNLYIADNNNFRIRKVALLAAPAGPAISANGVVNAASFEPGIVPNGWASILGSGFSTTTSTWDNAIVNARLPTTLEGINVTIDGQPAYLAYVSPTQINLLVPDVGVGPKEVILTTSAGARTTFTVNSRLYGPAFFLWPNNQPVATRPDFTFAARAGTFPTLPTTPARPGDVIILWGSGFGPTNPPIPYGIQVPADRTYSTTLPPLITVNGIRVTVFGAALAPGFAGLYQVAIEVPPTLPDGDWPVVVTMGGASSPAGVNLTVRR